MTPAQEKIVKDPVGYFLLMLTIFPGLTCPISLVIVEDPDLRTTIAVVAGVVFAGLLAVVWHRGRKEEEGSLHPGRIGFFFLGVLFAGFGLLAAVLAVPAWTTMHILAGTNLTFGAFGFSAGALFCFRSYKQNERANRVAGGS